ncbi:MAG TPA: glutamate racemase [Anaerolineaceae bacterium]|nr:glutamate racemase [Anaerolineaceae bacterium]
MVNSLFPLSNAIGIFDSGVGGLSVYREIKKKLPSNPIIYFADQFHVPYGPRTLEEVFSLSFVVTNFLLKLGAGVIVIACNTASAAALYRLREIYPDTPFVGMEPAVKPAAEHTHTGSVGVLATPATFQGKLYNSVVERFAKSVKIYQDTCSGLVQEIEKGNFSGSKTKNILVSALTPMIEKEIDSVVLGCTHYPFVIPLIKEIVGPDISVIDPSPAIANQTYRKIIENDIQSKSDSSGQSILITSGSTQNLRKFLNKINLESEDHLILKAIWSDDKSNINFVQE